MSKSTKKIFVSWIGGKTGSLYQILEKDISQRVCIWLERKGNKAYWLPGEWPPRKVTITIEVEDRRENT